ncbi:hypothetical protein Tco_0320430 [Tanacetum coccineum]
MTTALSIENGSSIEGGKSAGSILMLGVRLECKPGSRRDKTKLRNQIFRALAASADVPSSVTKTTDTTSTLQPPRPQLQTNAVHRDILVER